MDPQSIKVDDSWFAISGHIRKMSALEPEANVNI